jgi:hypothetical protein
MAAAVFIVSQSMDMTRLAPNGLLQEAVPGNQATEASFSEQRRDEENQQDRHEQCGKPSPLSLPARTGERLSHESAH